MKIARECFIGNTLMIWRLNKLLRLYPLGRLRTRFATLFGHSHFFACHLTLAWWRRSQRLRRHLLPPEPARWWSRGDSNSRPPRCERDALPAELLPQNYTTILFSISSETDDPSDFLFLSSGVQIVSILLPKMSTALFLWSRDRWL